ncbi:CAP domain-containing protein, partial [Eubacterium sp.]|uniref:CAP domain-containing protein n=1 Tax=Eubacterium sp. TaxID=142586 RepID=UPI0025D01F1D
KRYISNILINGTSVYSCNLSYLEVEKGNHKKIKAKDLNLNTGDQLNLNYDSDSKEYKGSIKCFKVKANNRKIDISIKTSKAMIQVTNVTRDINKVVVPTSKTNYFTTPKWKVKGKYKNYSKKSKYTGTYCLFTWKKAKLNKLGKSAGVKFKGYEVYRRENAKYWYENGKKKYAWTKVKIVKKKSNSYKLSQAINGSDVRLKVRAYGNDKKGNIIYGKFSKVIRKKVKRGNKAAIRKIIAVYPYTKPYLDKFASEDAFNYQNKLRRKNGKKELIWSDIIYSLSKQRDYRNKDNVTHDYLDEDIRIVESLFKNKYNNSIVDGFLDCSENASSADSDIYDLIDMWMGSKGHRNNMLSGATYGAISMGTNYTSYANFSSADSVKAFNYIAGIGIKTIEAEW